MREREAIVVGAGVAGLGAACALAGAGRRVTLLERRPYVGGRAYSYLHPALDEVVDSQHVLLGCCTNLIDFCEAAGLAGKIHWYDGQVFLEPLDGGPRASGIELGPLPAPMQYAGSFARARMLTAGDKAGIARGLAGLMRGNHESDAGSVAGWYARTRQTEGAIRHFWEPIVLATLNDVGANCSMKYAGKVFYELFLKTRTGGRLGIPTMPLSEFYRAGAEMVERLGGRVELRAGVEQVCRLEDGRWSLRAAEREFVADDVVLALPFEQTRTLVAGLGGLDAGGEEVRRELLGGMEHFEHSPFISVLLWFDREITPLDHAWLLDTTIQWFFHKSRIRGDGGLASYVEVIIAGSKRELKMGRAELLEVALGELARFFPAVAEAKLVKSGIFKEARATFSVTPGLDRFRPDQAVGIPGLFLAGDWTRTDWPSTMEGAVRSGRLAAGAVCGEREQFVTPDLPASGLMSWLARG